MGVSNNLYPNKTTGTTLKITSTSTSSTSTGTSSSSTTRTTSNTRRTSTTRRRSLHLVTVPAAHSSPVTYICCCLIVPFLLTNLLLDLMKKTSISFEKDCRIINVTSSIHFSLKSEEECVLESEYIINNDGSQIMPGLFQAYRRSKLCNALFTQMIYKQVKEEVKSMDSSIIGVYCLLE